MGGKALKNVKTRRYLRSEFDEISIEVQDILKKTFSKVGVPRFYKSKESFGDLDVVLTYSPKLFSKDDYKEYIKKTFNPNEIFVNTNMFSFDYKEFQVDLIFVHEENFQTNLNYFADNDLGNYIGNIAKTIGFKYGMQGFWFNYIDSSDKKNKIILTRDTERIFEFLDLDYSRWLEGFNTIEDTFEFVIDSKYFNPEIFQLSRLDRINRERNLKRPNYMKFLDFIKDKGCHKDYSEATVFTMKNSQIHIIRNEFPEVNIDIRVAEFDFSIHKKNLVKIKFNGHIIKELTGLEGKELGSFISDYKDMINFCHNDFNNFIVKNDINFIKESISKFFKDI